jgi:hypothetical protein
MDKWNFRLGLVSFLAVFPLFFTENLLKRSGSEF